MKSFYSQTLQRDQTRQTRMSLFCRHANKQSSKDFIKEDSEVKGIIYLRGKRPLVFVIPVSSVRWRKKAVLVFLCLTVVNKLETMDSSKEWQMRENTIVCSFCYDNHLPPKAFTLYAYFH